MSLENASKKYKKLLQKRDNLVRAIMHHSDTIKKGVTATAAATRLTQLESSFAKYSELMESILDHDDYDFEH